MLHPLVKEARAKMDKSLDAFRQELGGIRTGRASVGILDTIEVDAYGSRMKLNQLANVTAPEARLLVLVPYDRTQIGAIEKAILASPVDLTPSNDGKVIRIPIPPLTEERRKELVKMVGKLAEEARISVRNIRRHLIDEEKKAQKNGEIPEDEAHKLSDQIQQATDDFTAQIDKVLQAKEDEIMEV